MCRHLAYVGPPVRLGALLADPAHGLVRQSWAPRHQQHGVVNADGFGIGWYAEGFAEPARHRGAGPVWADETFADLVRVITGTGLLAAVRSATPGSAAGADAAAPLRRGRWLFSHNGRLDGWPDRADALAAELAPGALLRLDSRTDSALLWELTHDLLARGRPPVEAVADVVRRAAAVSGGRLNLLLTDGRRIAATAYGDSLFWRRPASGSGVVVASEPYDDEPGWHQVADAHVLGADPSGVVVTPL